MHTIEFVPSGTWPRHDRYLHELSELLGSDVQSGADLATLAARRLPVETLDRLLHAGLVWDELAFIIPRRTLSHRKVKGEALTVDESDKAIRLARILAHAAGIFGQPERALHWLRKKQQRMADRSPLELASTEQGAHLVEEQLLQIDEEYFA